MRWFRARADMQRWVEEVEILEEEFRRFIRGCEKMSSVWDSLAGTLPVKYGIRLNSPNGAPTSGYRVYALQKASMYQRMASDARHRFDIAGGQWPKDGETLSEHVLRRRPKTEMSEGEWKEELRAVREDSEGADESDT